MPRSDTGGRACRHHYHKTSCARAPPASGVNLQRAGELGHKCVAFAPEAKAIVLADSSLVVGGRSLSTKLSTGTRQVIAQSDATVASLTRALRNMILKKCALDACIIIACGIDFVIDELFEIASDSLWGRPELYARAFV